MPRKWTKDKLLATLQENDTDISGWVEDEKDHQSDEEAKAIIAQGVEAQLDYLISRNVSLDEIADEFLNLADGPYDTEGQSECQNCEWVGETVDAAAIDDLYQRVAPGEPMPSGQCPKCGALCHLKE